MEPDIPIKRIGNVALSVSTYVAHNIDHMPREKARLNYANARLKLSNEAHAATKYLIDFACSCLRAFEDFKGDAEVNGLAEVFDHYLLLNPSKENVTNGLKSLTLYSFAHGNYKTLSLAERLGRETSTVLPEEQNKELCMMEELNRLMRIYDHVEEEKKKTAAPGAFSIESL